MTCKFTHSGGITKFSAKENFTKILKVSHFSLGFSLDESVTKLKLLVEFHQSFHTPIGIHQCFQDLGLNALTKPYENV